MFKGLFEPYMDIDDGLSVANGGNSPTPEDSDFDDDYSGDDMDSDDDQDDDVDDDVNDEPEDITQTQAFSQALSRARQRDREENAHLTQALSGYERLARALNGYGYEGSAEEIADQLEAANRGISVADVRRERELFESEIKNAVENHPAILAARDMQQRQAEEMLNMRIANDVMEIQQIDPTIKSIQDLASHPEAELIQALVNGGKSWAEAFKKVHSLTHKKETVDTKAHLQSIGSSGTKGEDLVEIPPSELAIWRQGYPDLSLKEITRKYNNSLKEV